MNVFRDKAEPTELLDAGSAVRALRERMGYSIEALSVTCGLASQEIEAIEEGADQDPAWLKRIAHALRVPLSEVVAAKA